MEKKANPWVILADLFDRLDITQPSINQYLASRRERISGLGRLPPYAGLHDGSVVVASASPWLTKLKTHGVFGGHELTQCSDAQIRTLINGNNVPAGLEDATKKVLFYRESPRNSWRVDEECNATDGNSSLKKARAVAAGLIIESVINQRPLPDGQVVVIGRDWEIISSAQNALGKARPRGGFKRESWQAYDIADQVDELFPKLVARPFYTAHSATALILDLNGQAPSVGEITHLSDLSRPIKELRWIKQIGPIYTFMKCLPSQEIVFNPNMAGNFTFEMFAVYCMSKLAGSYVEKNPGYDKIPGLIDWTDPIVRFALSCGNIHYSLLAAIQDNQLEPYLHRLEQDPRFEAELGGVSVMAMQEIARNI